MVFISYLHGVFRSPVVGIVGLPIEGATARPPGKFTLTGLNFFVLITFCAVELFFFISFCGHMKGKKDNYY